MSELDQIDQALTTVSTRSAFNKDSVVGDTVTGTIVDVALRQILDYSTKKPKTWDDGRHQMQVVIRIQTDQREDSDDTGVRGVYIKTWDVWKDALNKAIRAAGGSKASDVLKPGAVFTATFTGTEPSTAGEPKKVYAYSVKPAAVTELDNTLNTNPAPAVQTTGQDGVDKVKQLIKLGLDDTAIAAATGLDTTVVATIRAVS